MYCSTCGEELPEGARFCPFCGASIVKTGEKLKYISSLSNKQRIWLLSCGIWSVVWLIITAIEIATKSYYVEYLAMYFAFGVGVPLLATLVLLLCKRIKLANRDKATLHKTPFVEFIKQYDGVRVEKAANKYTGQVSRYCVFSTELRVQFDDSIDLNMTADEISKIKNELWVVSKGSNQYVISRQN